MSSRHQPAHGADSAEARGPYVVTMVERFDGHPKIDVRIPAAYGPNDAKAQASLDYPGYTALRAVPA